MILRALVAIAFPTLAAFGSDFNGIVLDQIRTFPVGGGYAVTRDAHAALASAVSVAPDGVRIRPEQARPSYCSGATYLVLLRALGALQKRGELSLSLAQWSELVPAPVADGTGIWGRWNANGPGAACLVYELGAGRSFTSFEEALPGDFLKLFWTDAVGRRERGHLVVFVGTETVDGVPHVRFWSSNIPGGHGEKSIPVSKVARALFTRIETPAAFANVSKIPASSPYLASLLTRDSSFAEALKRCGISVRQGSSRSAP